MKTFFIFLFSCQTLFSAIPDVVRPGDFVEIRTDLLLSKQTRFVFFSDGKQWAGEPITSLDKLPKDRDFCTLDQRHPVQKDGTFPSGRKFLIFGVDYIPSVKRVVFDFCPSETEFLAFSCEGPNVSGVDSINSDFLKRTVGRRVAVEHTARPRNHVPREQLPGLSNSEVVLCGDGAISPGNLGKHFFKANRGFVLEGFDSSPIREALLDHQSATIIRDFIKRRLSKTKLISVSADGVVKASEKPVDIQVSPSKSIGPCIAKPQEDKNCRNSRLSSKLCCEDSAFKLTGATAVWADPLNSSQTWKLRFSLGEGNTTLVGGKKEVLYCRVWETSSVY